MKPGRELDALVAEKVMGLVRCTAIAPDHILPCHAHPANPDKGAETPLYSTDIAAAWEVVEKIKNRNINLLWHEENQYWYCCVHNEIFEVDQEATSESAPHAICLAALKAVGEKVDGV